MKQSPAQTASGSTTQRTSASHESQSKLKDLKKKLKLLFLNYCELSQEAFLQHSSFMRLLKDSGLNVAESKLSVLMSATLQTKTNLIKKIEFKQFLNLLSALPELTHPKLFLSNPKKALQTIIDNHLLKLLKALESKSGLRSFGLVAAFSQSLKCQD